MHFARRNQDSTVHLNYFSANDASYVLTDGVTAPSTLGYRYISTVSDFLIMMLFINAAENLRKISTRIHFSVKSEIHQMMILTKRVLGQRDP